MFELKHLLLPPVAALVARDAAAFVADFDVEGGPFFSIERGQF